MRTVKGNFSWPRPGTQKILRAIQPGPDLYRMAEEFTATKADQELGGLTPGVTYRRWVFDGYPIVIDEDTTFVGANFSQENPHTDGIFSVSPGVRLVFDEHCNLLNVTIPDGAEIHGGNLEHGIDAPTGDLARPTIKLLCECEKCCTADAQLAEDIAARTLPQDAQGRILHHEMKARYAARRLSSATVTADRSRSATKNAAVMTRFGRTVTSALRTQLGRGT